MGKVIGFLGLLMLVHVSGSDATAASGKCMVIDIDGSRMVIDCPAVTKGFVKGSKIKIKSDKDETLEGGLITNQSESRCQVDRI